MAVVTITVDCVDPQRVAEFWAALLGYRPVGAVEQYVSIGPEPGDSGPKLIFQGVPEPKSGKNRLHLDIDLEPGEDLDGAVARAVALGASITAGDPVAEFGLRWRVMADPEGNEFCIVAPAPD